MNSKASSHVPSTGFRFLKSLLGARTVLSSGQCAQIWWMRINSTGPLPHLFFLGFGPSLRHMTSRHMNCSQHLGLPLLSPCSLHLIQEQIQILNPPPPRPPIPISKLKPLSVSNLPAPLGGAPLSSMIISGLKDRFQLKQHWWPTPTHRGQTDYLNQGSRDGFWLGRGGVLESQTPCDICMRVCTFFSWRQLVNVTRLSEESWGRQNTSNWLFSLSTFRLWNMHPPRTVCEVIPLSLGKKLSPILAHSRTLS